jgi:lysyl-tRNA synthetase, class II
MIVPYQGNMINLTPPWRRVPMNELVQEKCGVDFLTFMEKGDLAGAQEAAIKAGVAADLVRGKGTPGEVLNVAFEELCEADLIQPTFVMDHPTEVRTKSSFGGVQIY